MASTEPANNPPKQSVMPLTKAVGFPAYREARRAPCKELKRAL